MVVSRWEVQLKERGPAGVTAEHPGSCWGEGEGRRGAGREGKGRRKGGKGRGEEGRGGAGEGTCGRGKVGRGCLGPWCSGMRLCAQGSLKQGGGPKAR